MRIKSKLKADPLADVISNRFKSKAKTTITKIPQKPKPK